MFSYCTSGGGEEGVDAMGGGSFIEEERRRPVGRMEEGDGRWKRRFGGKEAGEEGGEHKGIISVTGQPACQGPGPATL